MLPAANNLFLLSPWQQIHEQLESDLEPDGKDKGTLAHALNCEKTVTVLSTVGIPMSSYPLSILRL